MTLDLAALMTPVTIELYRCLSATRPRLHRLNVLFICVNRPKLSDPVGHSQWPGHFVLLLRTSW